TSPRPRPSRSPATPTTSAPTRTTSCCPSSEPRPSPVRSARLVPTWCCRSRDGARRSRCSPTPRTPGARPTAGSRSATRAERLNSVSPDLVTDQRLGTAPRTLRRDQPLGRLTRDLGDQLEILVDVQD